MNIMVFTFGMIPLARSFSDTGATLKLEVCNGSEAKRMVISSTLWTERVV